MLELMAEQPVTGPDNSAANRRRVAPVANRTPRVYRSLGFSPARRVVPHRMKTQRLAERSGAKLPAGVPCPARHICTYFILGSSQGNHSKTDEAFGCELPSPGTDIVLPGHRHGVTRPGPAYKLRFQAGSARLGVSTAVPYAASSRTPETSRSET